MLLGARPRAAGSTGKEVACAAARCGGGTVLREGVPASAPGKTGVRRSKRSVKKGEGVPARSPGETVERRSEVQ